MHEQALKNVPVFADLTHSELQSLLAICSVESVSKDTVIFEEGAEGDKIYILIAGEVRISKFVPGIGEEALAILKKGEFFGEMSLVDDAPRSATAIAHSDVDLLSIGKTKFDDFLFLNKDVAYTILWAFLRTLNKRLRDTNNKIKSFFAMSGGF